MRTGVHSCRHAALFALVACAALAQAAPADTPQDAVNQVSQSSYTTYQLAVQDMGLGLYGGPAYNQGYRNRYNTGGSASESLGFKEATLYLTDKFTALGLNVTVQSDYKNVVAELPGSQTPDRVYIISGHYDHPQFNGDAPGGDDNASGTAAVLEAARILSQYQFKSTIRFIAWGGEEGWMLGSWDYANNVIKPAGDPAHQNLIGMLNLDMILHPRMDNNPTAPIDLDVSTKLNVPGAPEWYDKYASAVARYAPSLVLDTRDPQTADWYPSDQGPFLSNGFPGLMIAENTADEIWGGSNAEYHQAPDASDRTAGAHYDYPWATDVVRASVGMIAEQAQMIPEPGTMAILAVAAGAVLRRRRGA